MTSSFSNHRLMTQALSSYITPDSVMSLYSNLRTHLVWGNWLLIFGS